MGTVERALRFPLWFGPLTYESLFPVAGLNVISYNPAIVRYLACLPLRYRPYFLKKRLAYIIGSVDQELRLRNEYLMTENHLLRKQIAARVHLNAGDCQTLADDHREAA